VGSTISTSISTAQSNSISRLLAEHPHKTVKPRRPDLVIDSGNGMQALWRFDARPATPENIDLLGRANRWILKQYGGDKGTWNPAQLLRLPGTSNFPDKKKRQAGITAIKSAQFEGDGRRLENAISKSRHNSR
jgi:hypothetical protein